MSSEREKIISFSPPDISEMEIEEVCAALRSGWITTGPRTKKLEKELAEWIGTEKCVCLNSQTACAELVLHVLGVGEGDEVVVPAYTYTASASVIDHVGAKIVLIDSQKDNVEMDYDALEAAINERTKAIIPVDLGGVPCDYARIFEIAERKKHLFKPANDLQRAIGRVAVCADTAHALGAKWHGKMIGTVADFSCFSFHAVKNFTTAEGGAITWMLPAAVDSEALYHRFQLLSLHGQSKDALSKTRPGDWEYDVVGLWYKCNMTDMAAALGLAQFQRYPHILKRRRDIVARYDAAIKPLGIQVLDHFNAEHESSGHLYITRVPGITSEQRNEIIHKMADCGIACNVHYKPLPMHTAYKALGFDIADFPNAYAYFENEITLPLHTCLSDEDVEYVKENYVRILKEYL